MNDSFGTPRPLEVTIANWFAHSKADRQQILDPPLFAYVLELRAVTNNTIAVDREIRGH